MKYRQAPIHLSNATKCLNWTYLYEQDLHPNGDIDGPGVIVSFIGTGFLVYFILLLNYIISHDPEAYPFTRDDDAGHSSEPPGWWKPNPIDVVFLSWIRKLGKRFPPSCHIRQPKRLEAAFNRAILIMCDVQIFTGISVLISGFVLLPRGIQAYHWQIIVYIAWFSSITHISAMTTVRALLSRRRMEISVRFGLMVCLLTMLIIAFIPTAFFDWANSAKYCSAATDSSPAVCFFDIANGSKLSAKFKSALHGYCYHSLTPFSPATQATALSLALLVFGFVSRSVKLFEPLSKTVHVYFRQPVSKFAQKVLMWLSRSPKANRAPAQTRHGLNSSRNGYINVLCQPCMATFLFFRIAADLFGSMLAEIYWTLVLVAWGTMKLITARASSASSSERQDDWTFGQMLPVLLLAAPVWSLLSSFAFSDRNEQLHYLGQEHETCLMTVSAAPSPSTPELIISQGYSSAPSRANSRGIGSIAEIQCNDATVASASSGYISCCWIGPCLAAQCVLITVVTVLQILPQILTPISPVQFWVSPIQFWGTYCGMIYLFLVVCPFASQCTILLGLVYEEGLLGDRSIPSRSRAFQALSWVTTVAVWAFFIFLWLVFLTDFYIAILGLVRSQFRGIRYGATAAGTAVIHLVYALGYFVQAFRKGSRVD